MHSGECSLCPGIFLLLSWGAPPSVKGLQVMSTVSHFTDDDVATNSQLFVYHSPLGIIIGKSMETILPY